jgi:Mn2+/Fe2+ NRAMP family transporter
MSAPRSFTRTLAIIGPGLLVAATGVGAGDLATGAFAGSHLGTAVLWAVVVGALFKFTVNEGLARWQLATDSTLLEGIARHFGRWAIGLFLAYLLFWSFFVASALMGACGAAFHALLPWIDARTDKIVYGIGHSLFALALIRCGGFRLFEGVMSACIAVMFVVVVVSAVAIGPQWGNVLAGLLVPRIPHAGGQGLSWTVALMGGIGGTVTVLSYGYWIREEGRRGPEAIATCRIDLASGYAMMALFGLGMVIVGSELLDLSGDPEKGTAFVLNLAQQIEGRLGTLGPALRWGFVLGAWCAVFSSMLGVWQSVPYIFADCWRLLRNAVREDAPAATPQPGTDATVDVGARPYVLYQLALAIIPLVSLWFSFEQMQKWYAIVGAFVVPALGLVLLVLNRRRDLVGPHTSGWAIQALLLLALVLFAVAGAWEVADKLWPAGES